MRIPVRVQFHCRTQLKFDGEGIALSDFDDYAALLSGRIDVNSGSFVDRNLFV
jgi:hypothetical protein